MNQANEKTEWNEAASWLKAMAHPVRLAILDDLCRGPQCVNDVHQVVDVSQPNLSQHLAALKKAGLVGSQANGPMRCYYLLRPGLVKRLMAELKKDHPTQTKSCDVLRKEMANRKAAAAAKAS
ncbi:MAG: metalloregulator ArsR/SmtB family transcription factor [bacterium]|nr:metalloregulator ArsR/SmtB family transcription factor [bacterium]